VLLIQNLSWTAASEDGVETDVTVTPPTTIVSGAVTGFVTSPRWLGVSQFETGSQLQIRCGKRNHESITWGVVSQPRNAVPRAFVSFLALCSEVRATTATLTLVAVPPVTPTSRPQLAAIGLTTVVAVTYTIALPYLQVSLRALTLARLCDANSGGDDDEPFLSGPMDNPLQIVIDGNGIPHAARYVAGSVVGNVVFCGVFSVIGLALAAWARYRNGQQRQPAQKTFQLRAPQSRSFGASLRCSLAHFTTSMAFPYAALAEPLATASSALFVTATVNVRDDATGVTAAFVVLQST
jgi:hypothetical protein